jgi:hypothetical protein
MFAPTTVDERNFMTVRQYAAREGITLGTAYRRIWAGQVKASRFFDRWVIQDIGRVDRARDDADTDGQG